MFGQTWTDVKRKRKKRSQIEKNNVVSGEQNFIVYPRVFFHVSFAASPLRKLLST